MENNFDTPENLLPKHSIYNYTAKENLEQLDMLIEDISSREITQQVPSRNVPAALRSQGSHASYR
jgi:hypothetical protein